MSLWSLIKSLDDANGTITLISLSSLLKDCKENLCTKLISNTSSLNCLLVLLIFFLATAY